MRRLKWKIVLLLSLLVADAAVGMGSDRSLAPDTSGRLSKESATQSGVAPSSSKVSQSTGSVTGAALSNVIRSVTTATNGVHEATNQVSAVDSSARSSQPARINPYRSIVLRNPFGLVPPPQPTKPKPEPPPQKKEEPKDLGELKLSGITTLLGERAMFVLIKGNTNIYSGLVAEGERDAFIPELEVLEIDPAFGRVRVRFAGVEKELNFEEHGLEPPKAQPTVARTQAGATRIRAPVTGSTGTRGTTPARVVPRSTVNTSSSGPGAPSIATASSVRRAGQTVYVSPRTRVRTVSPTPRPSSSQAQLSAEERQRRLELQRRLIEELGLPMPPLPPLPTQPNRGNVPGR